jgi:2,5-diketo-D-gluconate reductase A
MTTDRAQAAVTLSQASPMPLVGLGTWQMTGARCQAAVRSALEVGYRHIDTATMYRNEPNTLRLDHLAAVRRKRDPRPMA